MVHSNLRIWPGEALALWRPERNVEAMLGKYPANERRWVMRLVNRLTAPQRARYELACQEATKHYNGRLHDRARAQIVEAILLMDTLKQ